MRCQTMPQHPTTQRSLTRLLVCVAFLMSALRPAAASDMPYPASSWAKAKPGAWNAEQLKAADGLAASLQTDSDLVVHRGKLVHRYDDITKPRIIFSMRKSVLSVLIGMSVDSGSIDIEQPLSVLGVDDIDGLSEQEETSTLTQLLQSRSRVYYRAAYETREAKANRPARGSHAPGTFWYYNNRDLNTAGAIYQQRAGRTVFEALRDDLGISQQFEDFQFARDTEFVREPVSKFPARVMKHSARDLARIGVLMARDGRWEDRQLVSANWVARSTDSNPTVLGGWQGYGYMRRLPKKAWPFWKRIDGDVFFAWRSGGQYLFVNRSRDLVIVHQVDLPRFVTGDVTPESISRLPERILAAAPDAVER